MLSNIKCRIFDLKIENFDNSLDAVLAILTPSD
jgi:hypothetical protein